MSFRLEIPDVNKEIFRTYLNLKKSKAVNRTGGSVQYSVIKQKRLPYYRQPFFLCEFYDQAKSNLSRFITLFQAATKSFTNLPLAPALPYTSATARSSALEPNTRSALVAVHLG